MISGHATVQVAVESIRLGAYEFIEKGASFSADKLLNYVNRALESFELKREKDIIESYFGLNTDIECMTLEAIGDKFGITKERVRQLKEKAIRKMRHNASGIFDALNE